MEKKNRFGVLGGDKRQIYLAQSLALDGYPVYVCGFDKDIAIQHVTGVSLQKLSDLCNVVILPLPVTQDGLHLHTPFCKEKIVLDDTFAVSMAQKRVFGGGIKKLLPTSVFWNEITVEDYSLREEFAVRNAVPTAEGAVMIAMELSEGTIYGSECLVAGYGRIGKILSRMLKNLGANVTVSARKTADLAWIQSNGCKAVHTAKLAELPGTFDFVFNTVPTKIFTKKVLARHPKETLFLELASVPGGFDKEAVAKLGLHLVPALSLPGKVAPFSAAAIIKDTIYNMLEE